MEDIRVSKRDTYVLIALLSILGLAGNVFKLELFFNVDLIFGSVFSILAVRLFGMRGAFAGFVASTYSYVLWNHPYAILIFTAEAVFVALFRPKLKNTVLTDVLYWLLIGMPLVFITYHIVMNMNLNSTFLIMMKQSVNGIFNALLATFLYDIIMFSKARRENRNIKVSYQHVMFQTMIVIIVLPMVFYVATSLRMNKHFIARGMQKSLNDIAVTSTGYLSDFMDTNEHALNFVAGIYQAHFLDDADLGQLNEELMLVKESNKYIVNISFTDKDFTHMHSLKEEESGQSDAMLRAYLAEHEVQKQFNTFSYLEDNQKKFIITRELNDDEGSLEGYIKIAVDFDVVGREISRSIKESDIAMTLIDSNNEVVLSTYQNFKSGQRWTPRNEIGKLTLIEDDVYRFIPHAVANVSVMESWKKACYTKSSKLSGKSGYTLITDLNMNSVVSYMNIAGKQGLAVVFIMLMLAIFLAFILSRRIVGRITALTEKSNNLPEKIMRGESIEWDETSINEIHDIQEHFDEVGDRLKGLINEIKKQKGDLEAIVSSIPMGIVFKSVDDKILMANDTAASYVRMNKLDMVGKNSLELFTAGGRIIDDDEVIATKKAKFNILIGYHPLNGVPFTARTSRTPILDNNGNVEAILVVIEDITNEIKAADEKEMLTEAMNRQSRMAEVGALMNMIIHQWKQPLNVISLVAQSTKDDIDKNNLDQEELAENMSLLVQNTDFLTQTITDSSFAPLKHQILY